MVSIVTLLVCAHGLVLGAAAQQPAAVRGPAPAIAAAERLLESAGGRAAWRNRRLRVEQRGFLRSGEVSRQRVTRDLRTGARIIESDSPTRTLVEWLSPAGGWSMRNGEVTPMSASTLAIELQGLKQEPYAVYHRLAWNDAALRVELREQDSMLYVYDSDERVLCWFQLDGKGGALGWGNYFDGRINQHYYGPIGDMGDANLPKWGAASNGSYRFEYVNARLDDAPVAEPGRGAR